MKNKELIFGVILASLIVLIELLKMYIMDYRFIFSILQIILTISAVSYFGKAHRDSLSDDESFGFGKAFWYSIKFLIPTFIFMAIIYILNNLYNDTIAKGLLSIEEQGMQVTQEVIDMMNIMYSNKYIIGSLVIFNQVLSLLFFSLINALIIKEKI